MVKNGKGNPPSSPESWRSQKKQVSFHSSTMGSPQPQPPNPQLNVDVTLFPYPLSLPGGSRLTIERQAENDATQVWQSLQRYHIAMTSDIPEKKVEPSTNDCHCPPPNNSSYGTSPTSDSRVRANSVGMIHSVTTENRYRKTNEIMADEIPMFPKATSMFIHSGNIINWNRLKRKPNQTSTEEVCECIGNSLSAYLEAEDKTQLQYVTEIYRINSENVQTVDENERDEVKMTVKVFVCSPQPASVIGEAVNKVLNELGTGFVETVLLAVAPASDDDDSEQSVSLSVVKPYWEALEELVSADKVLTLGICDLNKEALEDLYNWAKVKPSIDQVNLESCCVMPKELTEFAKSVSVQLLTHNDKPVFISKETLQSTIQTVSTERDSDAWTPQWVVRYSGILKGRGIIKTKGYIFHAVRDNKKRLL